MDQQLQSPSYWVFQESDEFFPFDNVSSQDYPNLWAIKPNSVKQGDIVYFWRRQHESLVYGWGVIASELSLPSSENSSTVGQVLGLSSEYSSVVAVTYEKFFSPVTSAEMHEDSTLNSLVEQATISGRTLELSEAQAVALNRMIRARGVEAPPDPPEELSEESDQGDNGASAENPTLAQVLKSYSDPERGLSILSRAILERAGDFARSRERNRDKITTDCLLFATYEEGKNSSGNIVDNAAQFLFRWIQESRSTGYEPTFLNSLHPIDQQQQTDNPTVTSKAMRVIETASKIANFVRKETLTSGRGKIRARDLLGAILYQAALNGKLYAAQSLTSMGASLETLRADYFNQFLNHEKNPEDDIKKWHRVIIKLRLPGDEHDVPRETKSSLPNIDADTPSVKTDLLNITPEVEGFAKIIAARDVKTPLSIGLFGDWGSGKSTFMEQLQATVEKIAKSVRERKLDEETAFLGNIVQIKFNAWHYAEANLWASLVSHVFENLSFSDEEEKEKAEKRKQLVLGQLVTGLAEQKAAETNVKNKEANYEEAKTALEGAKRAQQSARLDKLQLLTEGVWPLVLKGLSENDQAQRAVTEARRVLGREGLTEEELKRELEASRTTLGRAHLHLTSVFDDPKRAIKVAAILVATILVPLVLAFLVAWLIGNQTLERVLTGVMPLVTLLAGGFTWLRSKRFVVQRSLKTISEAEQHLDAMYATAKSRYKDELLRLNQEVAATQAEIISAKQRVQIAKTEVAETIASLQELEPGRVLEKFVQERAASTDYRKLLGVVALIRRDFKKLSDMLREQDNKELRQAVTDILKKDEEQRNEDAKTASSSASVYVTTAADNNGSSKVVAEPSKELVDEKLKEYRIDRIVLYIDDLDRCPPKQVVAVLEAVHLLLAFELFVVVVGVDARWVRNALRNHYLEMLSEDRDEADGQISSDQHLVKAATPRDYVEKIFQVPFWLKPMDDGASQMLLEGLIPGSQLSPTDKTYNNRIASDLLQGAAGAADRAAAATGGNVSGVGGQGSFGVAPSLGTSGGGRKGTQANPAVAVTSTTAAGNAKVLELGLKPDSLLLDINERNAMIALSRVIGKTPRTLKRFVNVYRIIKAGLNSEQLEAFVGTDPFDDQYRAVLVLLSVAHGAPDVAPTFFREIKRVHDQAVENKERDMGLKAFLKSLEQLPTTLDKSFYQDWSCLIRELETFADRYESDVSIALLREWLPLIVRYTFQLGRLSEEVANHKSRATKGRNGDYKA